MSGSVWFDPSRELSEQDALVDLEAPWLDEGESPSAQEWVSSEVRPLASDETPPQQHPGRRGTPLDATCPIFVTYQRMDPPPCGGLKDLMLERAWNYQRASIADPPDWDAATELGATVTWGTELPKWTTRAMRNPSAMNIYRLLPHYAHPQISGPAKRDEMLANAVLAIKTTSDLRSPLQMWSETADFTANGLLRLLNLYSDTVCEPDIRHSTGPYPLIPCHLQEEARQQLLGFKYFGDEPARGPSSDHEAVYWSENHQMLYATAEYLAGQLMPDDWFQPTQHRRDSVTGLWAKHTDTSWGMRGTDRMARAYPRLVRWLDHRLMFGFSEWNSPVYYDYEIAGLLNLIDFCDDAAVADKATLALDLVLFDLARFAGAGSCGATSGRAYPSHKFSSWGTRLSEVLQILFGHWWVDRRAEEVLEDWRVEHFEVKRADGCARAAADARNRVLPGTPVDPNLPDPGEEAIRLWDLEHHTDHERRRRPPINEDNPWGSADSPGAHSLATSKRYCVPDVFDEYAREPDTPWFERSRVSIGFEEGKSDYGIGYSAERDVLAWWSRAGFGAPQTIIGSRDLARSWSIEDMSPFTDITGLFWLPPNVLEAGARLLAVESEGSCLTNANLALWREKGAVLSSAQKFRFGQIGRQAHV